MNFPPVVREAMGLAGQAMGRASISGMRVFCCGGREGGREREGRRGREREKKWKQEEKKEERERGRKKERGRGKEKRRSSTFSGTREEM